MHFILNQNGELVITDEGEEVCELDETVEQVLKNDQEDDFRRSPSITQGARFISSERVPKNFSGGLMWIEEERH